MFEVVRVRAFPRLAGFAVLAGTVILPASASAAASGRKLGTRSLSEGVSGADVRALQHGLSDTGFRTRATGTFDASTERSVKSFERRYELKVDGVASKKMIATLQDVRKLDVAEVDSATTGGGGLGGTSAPAHKVKTKTRKKKAKAHVSDDPTGALKSPVLAPVVQDGGSKHLGERTLRKGMKGHDVRVLQSYLTLAGFPTGIDGQYGPSTLRSVVKFERANGLATNGVVTYAQSRTLREDVAKAVTTSAPSAPAGKATLNSDGTVTPPAGAPQAVVNAINAANSIINKPYIYGGGHGQFNDSGYDCSGAVSFALHGGGLLSAPEDSSGLESFGESGKGKWITVYADSGHAFMVIAGLAFDTAHYGPTTPSGSGPRWLQPSKVLANLSDGGDYTVRHPPGL